jgi:hypothetical protein
MSPESKSKYKNEFLTVRKLMNEFDPCDLRKMGAPIDEYDFLTQQLISYLNAKKSNQEIKDFILNEIETHFGLTNPNEFKEPDRSEFLSTLDKFIIRIKNM